MRPSSSILAWKADRWLFAHGPVAVVLAGAPLIPLLDNLWFVPAFLYVIAVLHVWLASLHESRGRLQARPSAFAPDEVARLRSAATKSWAAGASRRFARVRSSVALPPAGKVERQPRQHSVLRVVQREIERQHGNGVAALQQRERRDDRHRFDDRRPAAVSRARASSASTSARIAALGRMQDPRHAGEGGGVDRSGARQRVARARHEA